MKILTHSFLLFLCLLSLVAATATIATVAVSAVPHQCDHDHMKNMPGYGRNSPIVEGVKYAFHDDEVFKDYYKSRTEKGAASKHPHLKDDRPSRMRMADALTVNPGLTVDNMRFTSFFDQATCPGSDCGHCVSSGQTVQTFEGSATTTCTDNDVLTDAKKSYIMDILMPKAMDFLGNALRINPVVGNLIVGYGSNGKCGNPGTPVPVSHQTVGVPDSDFVIYVTAAPKADPTALTVAWALSCRRDGANRPIAAHVNFVPARLTNAVNLDPIEIQSDLLTAIHEISHALGFSAPFFDGNGYYDESYNFVSGGVLTQPAAAPFDKERNFINSPRVVREVRDLFGCPTAVGAEIEDQGGAGTAGSHWEKRIYQQHCMAGIGSTIAAYPSRMLLAYFEDYGHYIANYTALEDRDYYINYGRDKGCDFIDQKCDSSSNTNSGEYCWTTDQNIRSCTYDGLGIGYCSAATFGSNLPAYFQYFSNPAQGSSIQLDDFCPNVIFYSNQRCVASDTVAAVSGSGESFGVSSRCFQSDLISSGSSSLFSGSTSGRPATEQARCFETVCNDDGSMSVVVDLRLLRCPSDGSAGNADTTGLAGYQGTIICPPAARYCPRVVVNNQTVYKHLPKLTPDTSSSSNTGFAPAYTAPLPASCSARRACAQLAFETYMPACREAAFEISRCFGTDCDGEMLSYTFSTLGLATNCSTNKGDFMNYCQEGKVGANALCALGSAGKMMMSAVVFVCTLIVGMMMMI